MNIVFLGDSITDAGKSNNAGAINAIGQSYPMLICAKLGAAEPMQHTFVNSGISGNRCVDVLTRIEADCWNHKPDVVSVLLGVNDASYELTYQTGTGAKRFERMMRTMLQDTMEVCPNAKLILMEPYMLPGRENYVDFLREVRVFAGSVRKLAEEFSAAFVPLQEIFDAACERAPASYWAWDGVHATPAAHQLIADAWIKEFETIRK